MHDPRATQILYWKFTLPPKPAMIGYARKLTHWPHNKYTKLLVVKWNFCNATCIVQ